MVLLNEIIQVLTLPDSEGFFISFPGIECGQRRCIGTTLIDSHDLRFAMVTNGLAEETQCSCCIPFGGEQEVDGLAVGIHCTVQILPLAFDFDIYLTDEIMSVGDARFKQKCIDVFNQKRETASLIMVSHDMKNLRQQCDMGILLRNSTLELFDDIEDAIRIYQKL